MMAFPNFENGECYADGRTVRRAPIVTKTPAGERSTLGFPVCELSDYVGEDVAVMVAQGLNLVLLDARGILGQFAQAAHDARDALNGAGVPCPASLALAAEHARNLLTTLERVENANG